MPKPAATRYIETLIDEKGIDLDATFEFTEAAGTWHLMPYGVVVEAMLSASVAEQVKLGGVLRRIDFANGDVRHFLRHLAPALAAA